MNVRAARWFVFVGLVGLGLTIGYPVVVLFCESLVPGLIGGVPGRFLEAYGTMWETPGLWEMLRNSVLWGVSTTVGAWLLGVPSGWILARTDLVGKRWARILLLVPLMSPAYINALAYVLAMQPGGFGDLLTGGLPNGVRQLFFSFWGVTFVMVLASFGGVALAVEASLRGIPSRLEDAAATLGAGRVVTFLRVILPLLTPALINSGILVFLDAISNFGVPAVMGPRANLPLLPAEIYAYATSWPVDLALATALSALLCVGAVALLTLGRVLMSRSLLGRSRVGGVREARLGGAGMVVAWGWFLGLFLVAGVVPNAVIAATSFVDSWGAGAGGGVRWTVGHYVELFRAGSGSLQAVGTSFVLSGLTATVCVLLGAMSAYGIHRAPGRWAGLLDAMGLLPRMIPRIVTAIAFILAWNAPWVTLEIYNTVWLLVLAYFALYQSDALRFADTGMRQVGVNLEQAGAVLGASTLRIFWDIVLPALRPGLFAAWMTTFIVCMRDWVASIILLPPGVQTIGSFIFNQFDQGNISQAMAMTTCTVLLGTVVLVVLQSGGKRG